MFMWDETEEAEDEEHGAETAEAVEVERTSTDAEGHEEPRAKDTGHVDAVLTEGEVVGFVIWEAGLLEEIGGVSGEGVSRKILNGPYHADNFGASEVGSLEAIPVSGSRGDLLFESGGVDHH